MGNNKIELTEQELADIKDDVKWRTMVAITLKSLKGIPATVNSLRTQSKFQWAFLLVLIGSIVTAAFKVFIG